MGISSLTMDLISGMSAQKPVNLDANLRPFFFLSCHRDQGLKYDTACAAGSQDAFLLGVDIQKLLSL